VSYTNPHLLWSTDQLLGRMTDPRVVIMDLRPPEAYANNHIPGARSFDIFGISLIDTRPQALEAFLWIIEHLIQSHGVNSDSTVVIYDDIAGMRSARLFWFLEFFGHPDAPYAVKRKPKDWEKIQAELEQLRNAAPPAAATSANDPFPSFPSSE